MHRRGRLSTHIYVCAAFAARNNVVIAIQVRAGDGKVLLSRLNVFYIFSVDSLLVNTLLFSQFFLHCIVWHFPHYWHSANIEDREINWKNGVEEKKHSYSITFSRPCRPCSKTARYHLVTTRSTRPSL